MTLLELMVSMTLLTFIVFGLYSMFDRTQNVLRGSVTQVDVLDGGRAAMEMIMRDLEQMRASQQTNGVNFYVGPIPMTNLVQYAYDGTPMFTNLTQEFYFLTRDTEWKGVAYLLTAGDTNRQPADFRLWTNGVGTLTRFEITTNFHHLNASNLFYAYTNNGPPAAGVRYQRVAEGVVHLNLRAYTNGVPVDDFVYAFDNPFTNTFLPADLELEIGILEPKTLEQARGIPNPAAQLAFLTNTVDRASKIHIFRQRVRVRNESVENL